MIDLDKNLIIAQLNNDLNYYYNIIYYKYWKVRIHIFIQSSYYCFPLQENDMIDI